jgi:asparagine synthase (glutamine-hydrolysing)
VFGGYDWWYRPLLESERLPKDAISYSALRLASRALSVGLSAGLPLTEQMRWLWGRRELIDLGRAHPDMLHRHHALVTRFPESLRRTLWRSERRQATVSWLPPQCPPELKGVNRAFWFDITQYLTGDILVKVDRAAMAVGLETRCPLLDPEVVEFGLSLPASLKFSGDSGKYIFKRAFASLWPESIGKRAKHGFGAPETAWLHRPDVRSLVDKVVTGSASPLTELFDLREIRRRVELFYAEGTGFSAAQMWSLLTLGLWLRRWRPYLDAGMP